jgi:hypothetical protein
MNAPEMYPDVAGDCFSAFCVLASGSARQLSTKGLIRVGFKIGVPQNSDEPHFICRTPADS